MSKQDIVQEPRNEWTVVADGLFVARSDTRAGVERTAGNLFPEGIIVSAREAAAAPAMREALEEAIRIMEKAFALTLHLQERPISMAEVMEVHNALFLACSEKANARLIAAAPAMREALIKCEALISQLQDAMPNGEKMQAIMTNGYAFVAITRARAALALSSPAQEEEMIGPLTGCPDPSLDIEGPGGRTPRERGSK